MKSGDFLRTALGDGLNLDDMVLPIIPGPPNRHLRGRRRILFLSPIHSLRSPIKVDLRILSAIIVLWLVSETPTRCHGNWY